MDFPALHRFYALILSIPAAPFYFIFRPVQPIVSFSAVERTS